MTEFEARLVKNKLSVQLKYLNDFFLLRRAMFCSMNSRICFFRKKEGGNYQTLAFFI